MPTLTAPRPTDRVQCLNPWPPVCRRYDAPTAELQARLHFARTMAATDAALAAQQ